MNKANRIQRKDYIHAAWCYINAAFPLKDAHKEDFRRQAISDLDHFFQNTLKAEERYRRLCEKATLLSVVNCVTPVNPADVWNTLIDPRLALKCADLSGQQVYKLVRENPDVIAAIHITADHLLRFLQAPSEETFNDCREALEAIDAIQWMNTFIQAITLNLTFNNPIPKHRHTPTPLSIVNTQLSPSIKTNTPSPY